MAGRTIWAMLALGLVVGLLFGFASSGDSDALTLRDWLWMVAFIVAMLLLWALRSVFPPERMERALRRLFGRRDGDGPHPRDGS